MFHNILIGIDGSPASDCALEKAVELAADACARITVLTVIAKVPPMVSTFPDAASISQLRTQLETDAASILRKAVARIPDHISVTTQMSYEPVECALLRYAASGNHDVVIIGTRGRGRLSTALFGSKTSAVVSRCEVPVLVVHAQPLPKRLGEETRKRGRRGQRTPRPVPAGTASS
ncbi:MAG TPA: universal stress protein [Conexibacter sp.]|jgi:nucleotide-binding universal stress UspA family protein